MISINKEIDFAQNGPKSQNFQSLFYLPKTHLQVCRICGINARAQSTMYINRAQSTI